MAVPTAASLVRELAARMGEYALSAPTGAGTTFTLVDSSLNAVWPQDVGSPTSPQAAWVYGTATAASGNVGLERRTATWKASTSTLTFLTPWPVAINAGGGQYEIHARTARARKLEALNEATGVLGLNWVRNVLDEASLITAVNTWQYVLPSTVQWNHIGDLQLQLNTQSNLVGYPYVSADDYDWAIIPYTDASGNTTWRLQFGTLPPPGRHLRILAQAGYGDLVADADLLPLDPGAQRPALAFLYKYAMHTLQRWEAMKQPTSQEDRLEKQAAALLAEAEAFRQQYAPSGATARIVVPGQGQGTTSARSSADYLAAFGSQH